MLHPPYSFFCLVVVIILFLFAHPFNMCSLFKSTIIRLLFSFQFIPFFCSFTFAFSVNCEPFIYFPFLIKFPFGFSIVIDSISTSVAYILLDQEGQYNNTQYHASIYILSSFYFIYIAIICVYYYIQHILLLTWQFILFSFTSLYKDSFFKKYFLLYLLRSLIYRRPHF